MLDPDPKESKVSLLSLLTDPIMPLVEKAQKKGGKKVAKVAKAAKVNMVPPRSFQLNVMKPLLAFKVDTQEKKVMTMDKEGKLHHSSTTLVKTTGGSKMVQRYETPNDMDNRKTFNYQSTSDDYDANKSMASSMIALLESVQNSKDVFDDRISTAAFAFKPSSKIPQDRVFRLFLSDELKLDLESSMGNPEELGLMAGRFVERAKEGMKEPDNAFSVLLCHLLCADLGLSTDNHELIFNKKKEEIEKAVNSLGHKSMFGRQLFRQRFQDVPPMYLHDDKDTVALELHENYSATLDDALSKKAKTQDLSELVAQSIQIAKAGFKYSRYDFAPNMSVGIVDVNLDLTGTKAMKDYYFCFPNGSRIELINQTVLYAVSIPIVDPSLRRVSDFCYPKELSLAKDHQGVTAEVGDFAWLRLTIDKSTSMLTWLEGEEKIPDSCYTESEKVWFVGYDRQDLGEGEGERNENEDEKKDLSLQFINDVSQSLRVPICNRSGQKVTCIHPDMNLDLILMQDRDCSVSDFLSKLNKTLKQKKLINDQLSLKEISFQSLIYPGHAYRISVPDGKRKLIEVLKEAGYHEDQDQGRAIPYICTYLANSTPQGLIPVSKADYLRQKREGSAKSLKASVSDFFDFYYRMALDGEKKEIKGRTYFQGHSTEFFLPHLLFLDVGRLASGIVNPYGDLNLQYLQSFVQKSGIELSVEYHFKGAVLKSRSKTAEEYYPAVVDRENSDFAFVNFDTVEPDSRTAISKLDLESSKYLFFERKVKEQ